MNIKTSKVTKLMLTDLQKLDPVKVIIDDIDNGKGSIIITCFGKAWTAYWPAMGDRSVRQFFIDADNEYLAGNLAPQINQETQWNPMEDECGFEDFKPQASNEYTYICRIIDAIKLAFNEQDAKAT